MVQKILDKMIGYDAGDAKRIQHFVKVYSFAHMIGELEGLDSDTLEILDIAAILHDIGIHKSEEIYHDCTGKHQEELGPMEAAGILEEFGLEKNKLDRICYLIGHHHTYDMVDGIDYRILIEADFIVNAYEDELDKNAIRTVKERIFRTKTGTRILSATFGV